MYETDVWPFNVLKGFALGQSLIGAVNLTKNADPDKYKCSGYGTGFNARGNGFG